jgi:hypothetical protein
MVEVTAAAFLTLAALSAPAQIGEFDPQRELASLRGARSVTTYIISPSIVFRIGATETTLKQIGCRSTTSDSEKIAGLVDLLEKGNFTFPDQRLGSDDFREGIYFTMPDGAERSILLGREFTDAPTSGSFEYRRIEAAPSLPPALRRWAFDLGFTTDTPYCIELHDEINNNP